MRPNVVKNLLPSFLRSFALFFISRFSIVDFKATEKKYGHLIDDLDGPYYRAADLEPWRWVKRWGIRVGERSLLSVRGTAYKLADGRTAYTLPRFYVDRSRIMTGFDFYVWSAYLVFEGIDFDWLLSKWLPAVRAYRLGNIVGQADFDLTAYHNDPMSEYAPGECAAPYSTARSRAYWQYDELPQTRLVKWAFDLGVSRWQKHIESNNAYWAQFEQDGPDDGFYDHNDYLADQDWAAQPTPYDP